jgi:protein-tyrosine phosphatase
LSDFELVFVCTANRFRSPIAAALVRNLTAELPVQASSYGTLELDPAPVLAEALKLGPRLGIDLDAHRSRCVRGAALAGADLVLGFERTHVATAVIDGGALRERAFLVTELVALLEAPLPDGARARVRLADERREELGEVDWPELADPAGGPRRGYAASARELDRLSRALVERLFA